MNDLTAQNCAKLLSFKYFQRISIYIREKGLWDKGLWQKGLWGKGLWKKRLWDSKLPAKGLRGKGNCENKNCEKGLWGKGLWDKRIVRKGPERKSNCEKVNPRKLTVIKGTVTSSCGTNQKRDWGRSENAKCVCCLWKLFAPIPSQLFPLFRKSENDGVMRSLRGRSPNGTGLCEESTGEKDEGEKSE